jgi:FAD binding domain
MNMTTDEKARLIELRDKLIGAGCDLPQEGSATRHEATRTWNGARVCKPALVARCGTALQVAAALRAARDVGLPVSVHNGGQDWAGRSLRDGSLVIDLSGMVALSIDSERREATIGGGVTAGQLNKAAGEQGLTAAISNDGAVGMAGLILGGGYGPLMTRIGLACDNLISAEVVLADGEVLICDADSNADLFWAVRGGGGNFGVLTSARVRLHELGPVLAGTIVFPWADVRAALGRFADLMLRAPLELSGAAVLAVGPGGKPVAVISLIWTGDRARGEAIIAGLEAAGTPLLAKVEPMPASELLALTNGKLPQGHGYEVATRWLGTLSPKVTDVMVSAFEARTSPLASIIIHHCHGAVTNIAPDATAFGMREPHFTALIYAAWMPAVGEAGPHRRWARELSNDLAPAALPGGYANLLPDDAAGQIAHAFGGNASRLSSLKTRFDPMGRLRAIPLPSAGVRHGR